MRIRNGQETLWLRMTLGAPRLLVIALLAGLPAAPALTDPTECSLSGTQNSRAAVVDLDIKDDNVIADIAVVQLAGEPLLAFVADSSGKNLTAPVLLPTKDDGIYTTIFPGAMAGAETRDIGYRIFVQTMLGEPRMDPYPFAILLDCPGFAPCSFQPLAGIEVGGVLVTEELDQELRGLPDCQLMSNLDLLATARPDLSPDIQTLEHQLSPRTFEKSSGTCRYVWKTVVPKHQSSWESEENSWPADADPVLEVNGLRSGAAHCYSLQARDPLKLQLPQPFGFSHSGESSLEMSILCVEGADSCSGGCTGTVQLALGYLGCLGAEARTYGAGASAFAEASERMSYEINGVEILERGGEIDASAAFPEKNSNTLVFDGSSWNELSTPVAVKLRTQGHLDYGLISSDQPKPSAWTAYAAADFNNLFKLVAEGVSSCTDIPRAEAVLQTPELQQLRLSGDGIKIKKWKHPDD